MSTIDNENKNEEMGITQEDIDYSQELYSRIIEKQNPDKIICCLLDRHLEYIISSLNNIVLSKEELEKVYDISVNVANASIIETITKSNSYAKEYKDLVSGNGIMCIITNLLYSLSLKNMLLNYNEKDFEEVQARFKNIIIKNTDTSSMSDEEVKEYVEEELDVHKDLLKEMIMYRFGGTTIITED